MTPSARTRPAPTEVLARMRAVRAPRPVLDRAREELLTARQLEILDQLAAMLRAGGFAELTMVELAAQVGCSLRTLYVLAPTKDELIVTAVDRHLRRIGRMAMATVTTDMGPLDTLRTYLAAATFAVSGTTEAFARDLIAVPAARRLVDAHSDYLEEVAATLLDVAVERGDIEEIDTVAFARVLSGVGREFAQPAVVGRIRSSPKDAADSVVDVMLRGLARPTRR